MSVHVVTTPTNKGVSGSRKAVSLCVLLAALVVLGVEIRAGLGQSRSAKQMAAISTDGMFSNVLLADAHQMLSLSPKSTVIRENKIEKVVHYQWGSLLRPWLGQPESDLFLVSSASEPAYAIAYYTDPEDAHSGLFGDAALMEYALEEPMSNDDNPLNLPDAPSDLPVPESLPPVSETAAQK